MTAEDKARALLGRMGIDGPFSSGELVELANLIADHDHQSRVLNDTVCFVICVDDQYDPSIFGIYSTLEAAKAYVEDEVAENQNCAGKSWSWLEEDSGRRWVYVDDIGQVFSHGRIDQYPLNQPAHYVTAPIGASVRGPGH